jgi:hypothetical protein
VFRAVSRLARPAALFMVALVATACSVAGAAPSGSPSAKPSTLTRSSSGSAGRRLRPAEAILGRLPTIVVYGDGRVITQDPSSPSTRGR